MRMDPPGANRGAPIEFSPLRRSAATGSGMIGRVRVLFTCRPLTGHLHPLVPLARAVAATGHEVAFATAEPALSDARGRGFAAFSAGPGREAREAFVGALPDLRALAPEEHRAVFFTQL